MQARERHQVRPKRLTGGLDVNINYSIREAVPGDAPDFASSQILAWRAAYAGILDAGYLAGMDLSLIHI